MCLKMSLKFCHKCGGKLEADPDFCDYCGADLRERKLKAKEGASSVVVATVPRGVPSEKPMEAKKPDKKLVASDQYANFFPRFAAFLIDLVLIFVFFIVGAIILQSWVAIVIVPLIALFYYWLLEVLNKGQTVGKMALKLRTVDATTLDVANAGKYLLNNLLKCNPLIILDVLLGIFANLNDPLKRKRIMQNASNTVVVRIVKK